MSDKTRIDTYNKEVHIHFGLKGMHIPIKYKEMETVGLIILLYFNKYKKINKDRLKEIFI